MLFRNRSYLSVLLAVVALVLASSANAISQEVEKSTAKVDIKNFGQMDERFFRGAQPKEDQYGQLAALGIKTVIDLREDTEDYSKTQAEAAGLVYVNIPMIAKRYPESSQVEQFMKLVDDPSTGKFFVHCAGGRHRTGAMGAVYRFNHYNWNFEQVYAEMKKYDFYTRWGHGDFKKFVQDYASSHQNKATSTAAVTASGSN
jgi:protein tyrosine/serine phosphatase